MIRLAVAAVAHAVVCGYAVGSAARRGEPLEVALLAVAAVVLALALWRLG